MKMKVGPRRLLKWAKDKKDKKGDWKISEGAHLSPSLAAQGAFRTERLF